MSCRGLLQLRHIRLGMEDAMSGRALGIMIVGGQ